MAQVELGKTRNAILRLQIKEWGWKGFHSRFFWLKNSWLVNLDRTFFIKGKETFKLFVRHHPELANYVLKNNTSWQQLYEIYELYGENNSIWNTYINKSTLTENITSGASTIKDFINNLKNIDMDSVQKGITNIQKTIGLLQDIGLTNSNEPQPIYKRFED